MSRRKRREFWHKQFFVIPVEMFRVDVVVAMNMTAAEVERNFAEACSSQDMRDHLRSGLSGWDERKCGAGNLQGRMIRVGGGFVVLLTADKDSFRSAIATITHEMVHVTQYLLREREIPLSEDTDEVHAYLTEYLVEQTLRRLYT